jgi:hypothetical protein
LFALEVLSLFIRKFSFYSVSLYNKYY